MKRLNLLQSTAALLLLFLCSGRLLAQDSNQLSGSFYKTFTGTIAGQAVIMQWRNSQQMTQISYEYLKYRQRIPLRLMTDSSRNGQLFFAEGENEDGDWTKQPVWKCYYAQSRISGTWYSADRKKSYPILLKEDRPEGVQAFTFQGVDTVVSLFPDDTSHDRSYDFEYAAPVALGHSETAKWLNAMIKKSLGFNPDRSLMENLLLRRDSSVADYLGNREDAKDNNWPVWSWQWNNDLSVDYNQNGYVVLLTSGYQYSGGAHGGAWNLYECLDANHRKQLALSDIISADSSVLEGFLEQQFRIDYDLKADDSLTEYLFENKLMPNDNFSFDGSGLYFTYNQYEVAPYVMGIITILIPWEKLKPWLNPEFAQRMGL